MPRSTSSAACDDRVRELRVEPAGLLVRQRRGFLDPDLRGRRTLERTHAADRKVLLGAQRLHAVQRGRGNRERAEWILLGARRRVGSRVREACTSGHGQGLMMWVLSVLYCDTTSS